MSPDPVLQVVSCLWDLLEHGTGEHGPQRFLQPEPSRSRFRYCDQRFESPQGFLHVFGVCFTSKC